MKCSVDININTLYVFHMLSVAKCSYDNAYGEKYKNLHNQEDLQILKKYESLITAIGGKYSGELMFLICMPASLNIDIRTIYSDIKHIFNNEIDQIEILKEYSKEILKLNNFNKEINEICDVFISNYEVYVKKVYSLSLKEIEVYQIKLQKAIDASHAFFDNAQKLTDISYPFDEFIITLTNSMDGGPEAIDITNNIDVFGINRPIENQLTFIQHEFIIYLFKNSFLFNYQLDFAAMWPILEGLAEFYLELCGVKITGFFGDCQKQLDLYRLKYSNDTSLTPKQLYEIALKENKLI